MDAAIPAVEISGVPVARLSPHDALVEVERLHKSGRPAIIAHVNVHTLNLAWSDPGYRAVLRRADLVLNDGKGIMLGARLRGAAFPADLNGNFFAPLVLDLAAARGWPVFLLGAKPSVIERAVPALTEQVPGLKIAGARDGYFTPAEEPEVVDSIKSSRAELVLVGLGNPRQEQWLDRCLEDTGARLGVGVGAFFDFQTGEVARAPEWMNRAGLEWVHRLTQEPRRMWRRYLVGNPQFVLRTLRERRHEGPTERLPS